MRNRAFTKPQKYAAARSSRSRAIVTLGFSGNVPTETGEITRRLGMGSWRSDSQSRGYIASFGKLHDDRRQAGAGVQSAHSSSGELWLRDPEGEGHSTPRKQIVTFESAATRRRVTAGSKPRGWPEPPRPPTRCASIFSARQSELNGGLSKLGGYGTSSFVGVRDDGSEATGSIHQCRSEEVSQDLSREAATVAFA